MFAIFASIKAVNYRLHTTFDKGEVVKREVQRTESDVVVSPQGGDLGEIAGSHLHLSDADFFPIPNGTDLLDKQYVALNSFLDM